ncbi:MAG TPA: hypothetical protein VLB80_04160 [Candidatus Babeliales bacterium]|nr:hypothetical protein [Candidatus Babeliales bacterium]
MTKLSLAILLLGACSGLSAIGNTLIRLASQQELRNRLNNTGFDHFVEKTSIDQELGGREQHPLEVINAVNSALYDYSQIIKNPVLNMLMREGKPRLIKIILQEHPQAIKYLKEKNLLQ